MCQRLIKSQFERLLTLCCWSIAEQTLERSMILFVSSQCVQHFQQCQQSTQNLHTVSGNVICFVSRLQHAGQSHSNVVIAMTLAVNPVAATPGC